MSEFEKQNVVKNLPIYVHVSLYKFIFYSIYAAFTTGQNKMQNSFPSGQLLTEEKWCPFKNDQFSIMHNIIDVYLCFQSYYSQIA